MKKTRFTEAQILKILKSQETGKKVSEICSPEITIIPCSSSSYPFRRFFLTEYVFAQDS